MRKLKLQVQMSVDGFIGGPNGEMDWMTWNWSDDIKEFVLQLHETVDTILLGRKMTEGFVSHWEKVVLNPNEPDYVLARKMVDFPKYVFTKTLDRSVWNNTEIVKGPLAEEVNKLKNTEGKDLVVYGGAGFDASLISENLIDEYYLFVNPTAIGNGLAIFKDVNAYHHLKLVRSIPFECGIVLLQYAPK